MLENWRETLPHLSSDIRIVKCNLLNRVVDYTHYQKTGQVLPVNDQTVQEMMEIIGASEREAVFVVDRMMANARAIAAL